MNHRYIFFPSNIKLLNLNILHAKGRDSICYIRYPYILELTHAEEWVEWYTTYITVDKMLLPLVNSFHHNTKDYIFKYKNLHDISAKIREMRDCGVQVENNIKHSHSSMHQ
jgi:hypothetical protein